MTDTGIDIAWQDPSLSPTQWEVFQGYKVLIRPVGSAEVNIITINALQNFASITELKSLGTYDISVAAYTIAGVGKESETITVTTTLGKEWSKVSLVSSPLPSTPLGSGVKTRFLFFFFWHICSTTVC